MNSRHLLYALIAGGIFFATLSVRAEDTHRPAPESHRTTLSLNGQWDVEDSINATEIPSAYHHTAPVPGLVHSAVPAFPDVDQYQTQQLLSALLRQGRYSQADYDKVGNARGITPQKRNYFWFHKTFQAPTKDTVALLRVNKAQFGTVVYLNGIRIGEHDPCFTSATFNITPTIHWNSPNDLVIRIGAHPGVLPDNVSHGTDFEKNRWTPGIYDDVTVTVMNNPVVSVVQIAPQLNNSSIIVQTELHNYADHAVTTEVSQLAAERKSHTTASETVMTRVEVSANATRTITQTVSIPKAHLWSPEDPFLYQLATRTYGDDVTTRFGMREFRFDTVTQRAYLNGRPYFMRGSNITLHRFFEDPDVGTLPWDEAWLHRLLVDIPKKMHWNSFRFCIGPVPDRWLEIADENGLLIQNEYMVWTGHSWGKYKAQYDSKEMITEYTEWMRDNWNHPSVAIWDATNESWLPDFTNTIIPAVRSLDLSNRPWENSYNSPVGANDPVEDHQYLFYRVAMDRPSNQDGNRPFQMSDLETMMGPSPNNGTNKNAHAMILNEYGWLWLNRDGSPTLLTEKLYPKLLGDKNTTENRFAMLAYLLGGETEFWRAYRRYAGILHFVYLTASDPKGFTSDHFTDVKTLKLEPHFEKAMEQAFNPLGVYLNFWHPSLKPEESHEYSVSMVNDEDRCRTGTLRLIFRDASQKEVGAQEQTFRLEPLGAQSYTIQLKAPVEQGSYSLEAIATTVDETNHPTVSHRDVIVKTVTAAD